MQRCAAQPDRGGDARVSRTLDFYIRSAVENAPALHDLERQRSITALQKETDAARVIGVHAWISSEYLFAPFFTGSGLLVSTNPPPYAVGYDAGITNGGQYSAMLHAERSLFTGGLTDALSRQSDARQDALRLDHALEERTLRKDVTALYLESVRLQMLRNLSTETVASLRDELTLLDRLQRMGLTSARDYLLLRIESEARQVELRDAELQCRAAQQQLSTLCGLPPDTALIDLQPVTLELADSGDGTGFLQRFVLDSLAIAAEQDVFDASYDPQIRLFANTGLNAVELRDIQKKFGFSAGFSLTLPLYDGGQKQRKQEQTALTLRSIWEYRRRSQLSVQTERAAAGDRLKTLRHNLQSVDAQLADFATVLEVSRRQLGDGGLSMIEYLTLLQKHIDMRKQQVDLRCSILQQINMLNYWSWQNDRQH